MLPTSDCPVAVPSAAQFARLILIRPHFNATVHQDEVLKHFGFIVGVAVPAEVSESFTSIPPRTR
jgi:hypothetical protein